MLTTLLAFLGAMGLLVTFHEWGHYRTAVACGVKVQSFSIGFGPALISWSSPRPFPGQKTLFVIRLFPLGGYVKMLDDQEEAVAPSERPHAFNRQVLWKRATIVAAGPIANFVLAFFLYLAICWMGQEEISPVLASPPTNSAAHSAGLQGGDIVLRAGRSSANMQDIVSMQGLRWWALQQDLSNEDVYFEVQSAQNHRTRTIQLNLPTAMTEPVNLDALGMGQPWSAPIIGQTQSDSPARLAGLQMGDHVLRVDGHQIEDAAMLRSLIRASAQNGPATVQRWDIRRGDHETLSIEIQPMRAQEGSEHIGRIGAYVGAPAARVWVQAGFWEGFGQAWSQTLDVTLLTIKMVGRLVTGHASLDHLGGPLSVADHAGRSASAGVAAYIGYLALLSISLAVLNLLPLPALDGGHLLYYLYEAIAGKPPSPLWMEAMQRAGFLMLLALMAFSIFNDLVRLGWLT